MTAREQEFDAFLDSDVIGEDFFDEIVAKKLNIKREKFKLRVVVVRSAACDGDNYNSLLYRVKIKVKLLETNENVSVDVIIKALLKTVKEFSDEFGYFDRERLIYEEILQSFEHIWLERANEVVRFGPQSYKFETDPYEIIVLEDLKASGYEMLDRKVGCTLPQAKTLLSKLSKFHAASAVCYRKSGMLHRCFNRKNSAPKTPEESPFAKSFTNLHVAFVNALKSYGDCELYVDKIAKWNVKKMFNFWADTGEAMRCGFLILAHGDLWTNNMMFKANDIKMFDFQATAWASPAYDILYFLLTSVNDEVKVENFESLIEFYHHELSNGLVKLEYDAHIPTLKELHMDLMDKGTFSAVCIMFMLFIFKYDCKEELNLQMIMGQVDDKDEMARVYQRIYGNETYRKALKAWLPFFDKKGFLDVLID